MSGDKETIDAAAAKAFISEALEKLLGDPVYPVEIETEWGLARIEPDGSTSIILNKPLEYIQLEFLVTSPKDSNGGT